jgi:hypothetical protein
MKELITQRKTIEPEISAEIQERTICNHRHQTIKKGFSWKCRKCGLVRILGVNSIADEANFLTR